MYWLKRINYQTQELALQSVLIEADHTMAASCSRSTYRLLFGTSLTGAAAFVFYESQKHPIRLDSGTAPQRNALSFPYNMLFTQQLTVTATEQINHDTKKITFALPENTTDTGVPPGSKYLLFKLQPIMPVRR